MKNESKQYEYKSPSTERILIANAKVFSDRVQRGIMRKEAALKILSNLKNSQPSSIEPFKKWMNTPEGRETMAILASS